MKVKKLKKIKAKPVKHDDISSRIVAVADIPDHSSTLLYGEGGTGKTALSGTWPKKMLIIDIAEHGTKTLKKAPGIDVFRAADWKDLEEVYWWLYDGKGKGKYKTVSLDQVSQMQDFAIEHVKAETGQKTGFKFWGAVSGLMKNWLQNFRDLQEHGMEMIFIAHQRTFDGGDEEGDDQIAPHIAARLMPSVVSFLNGAVSIVGNTFIREQYIGKGKDRVRKVDYCLRVGPHAVYRSKIRRPPDAGLLPDVIVNPTFEKLQKVSRGESLSTKPKVKVRKK